MKAPTPAAICIALALTLTPLAAQKPLPPACQDVELRVVDPKGGPVQNLRITLRGALDRTTRCRVLPDQGPRVLEPKDFPGDYAPLKDLPVGDFVWFVEADGYALTLSERFRLPADKPVRLLVKLLPGATVQGIVTKPDGKPAADAVVRAMAREVGENQHPFVTQIALMFVEPVTLATATTAADGSYKFEHMAPGEYALRAEHADFAEVLRVSEIKGQGKTTIPPLQLVEGGVLTGAVQRNTVRVAGATVVLQSVPVPNPRKVERIALRREVTTDAEGRFQLPRVPFGTYELMAYHDSNPLLQASQMGATKRTVQIKAQTTGEPQAELLILPK